MIACEVCGEKPAKIHVTRIENGKKHTVHMCQECARKQAAQGEDAKLSLSGMIGGFLGQETIGEEAARPGEQTKVLTCSGCGQTYQGFKESGRLGCAVCYETFEAQLTPLLSKIQKSDRHVGKRPVCLAEPTAEEKIEHLRLQLQKAVDAEEFEKAAELRDKIRHLEGQKTGPDSSENDNNVN